MTVVHLELIQPRQVRRRPGVGNQPDRSVEHFLDVLDELNRLNIVYFSFRESMATGGQLGRAIVVVVGAWPNSNATGSFSGRALA